MLQLVAAAEGGLVVAVSGGVGLVGVGVGSAGAAEGGLVAVLLVVEFALVFETREAGFYVVELAGGNDVVGRGGRMVAISSSELAMRSGVWG